MKSPVNPLSRREFFKTGVTGLTALGVRYFDTAAYYQRGRLYVHNCDDPGFPVNPGIHEALSELKAQKKVRFIGFSTHLNMAACLKLAVDTGFYDVVLTAFNYRRDAFRVPFIPGLKSLVFSGKDIKYGNLDY